MPVQRVESSVSVLLLFTESYLPADFNILHLFDDVEPALNNAFKEITM